MFSLNPVSATSTETNIRILRFRTVYSLKRGVGGGAQSFLYRSSLCFNIRPFDKVEGTAFLVSMLHVISIVSLDWLSLYCAPPWQSRS